MLKKNNFCKGNKRQSKADIVKNNKGVHGDVPALASLGNKIHNELCLLLSRKSNLLRHSF